MHFFQLGLKILHFFLRGAAQSKVLDVLHEMFARWI
jgi:hypothetical protein